MDNYTYKRVEEDKNKFKYEVTVDYSEYLKFEEVAFKSESSKVKIPGFRPGQAPKEMIEKEIASKVFSRAINMVLPEFAEKVMVKEELSPISHLHYDLTEFDKEKGVIFNFEVVVQPEINAEMFKGIKVEESSLEVTEKEIVDVIKNMVRNNVAEEKIKFKTLEVEGETKKEDRDFDLTDELVSELKYENTKNLEELKTNVKATLETLKKQQNESEYMNKVIQEALKVANFHVPHEMVDDQVAGIEEDFVGRLNQIKLSIENYVQTQGTSLEEMRKHWAEEATNRIASDLMLVNLAVKEGLVASQEDVDSEIEKMEDKNLKSRYQSQSNKDYLRTIMTRERGLTRLVDIVKSNSTKKN